MTSNERIEIMKQYLLFKFEEEDWHGVADAAMDLREMTAKISVNKDNK